MDACYNISWVLKQNKSINLSKTSYCSLNTEATSSGLGEIVKLHNWKCVLTKDGATRMVLVGSLGCRGPWVLGGMQGVIMAVVKVVWKAPPHWTILTNWSCVCPYMLSGDVVWCLMLIIYMTLGNRIYY